MILKRDLHVTETGAPCAFDDPAVAFMIGRAGSSLPDALAETYGVLGDPEYDASAKAIEGPPENKAVKKAPAKKGN